MEIKIITGVLLGAFVSATSYILKTKQENKKYFNEVLFNLLEIWKLINISYIFTSNVFAKAIFSRIKVRFPEEEISEKEEKSFQKFIPFAMKMVEKESGFSETNLYDRYLSSIQKLSSVQPVIAHRLSANQMMFKYLKGIDNYIEKYSENPETEEMDDFSENMIANIKLFIESDALKKLEGDLKSLSLRSGVFIWYQVMSKIRSSKERRNIIPEQTVDQFIDLAIVPLIQKHYHGNNKDYPYQ